MQPTFMPWVGYFDLINSVDAFVFLDDVQLSKGSWQVKNKIKTGNGESFITLPIKKDKSRDNQYINNSFIFVDDKWRKKTLKSIELNYGKTPYFEDILPLLKEWIVSDLTLSEIHIKMIKRIANMLSFDDVDFIASSSLDIKGGKETKLLDICKQVSAQTYLSPQGSSAYIQPTNLADKFKENNIDLFYHNYNPVRYKQSYGEFTPYLGIFDLLFNEGLEQSSELIVDGHRDNIHYKKHHKTL